MTIRASESISTAARLKALAKLYEQGQASELMTRTLDKALNFEADQCRSQLQTIQADLEQFEMRYGFSSKIFYERFTAGMLEDQMDYTEWASLVQMANNLRQRLRLLTAQDAA